MKKSFTLIEMLVAIFLFTLLFYLIMYSFKLYIKRSDVEVTLPKDAIIYEYLDKVISGYYPYIEKKKYFLKTRNNEISFVSLVPLISNKISLIKLTCKNNSLIYYQDYVFKRYQNYQKLKFIKPYKLILLKHLEKCQIIPFYNKNNFLKKIKIIINNKTFYFTTKSNWQDLNTTLFLKGENF